MKRILAAAMAVMLIVGVFAGCGKKEISESESAMLKTDFSKYKSSEEIPDWDGEELSIIKWVQAASPNSTCNKSFMLKDDPITKEIKRITGIDYNIDESFDNADSSFDAVIAKLIASDTFPHVGEGIPDVNSLVENDFLWDISEYVKEYAPTVYKLYGPESNTLFADVWERQMKNYGGVYELAFGTSASPIDAMVEVGDLEVDMELYNIMRGGTSAYPTISVREDILKKIYPEAHTNAELEAIYEKNGEFTKEEIFDVPLDTPEDFEEMLYKIRDLGLKEGSNQVYATFTHTGMDNWPACQQLGGMFGKVLNGNPSISYFQYYDKKTGEIKPTIKEPWFKDMLKKYNKWIRDGVASEEALVDTNNVFKEKNNNGNYAVTYGSYVPAEGSLRSDLKYRTVYARYQVDTENTLFVGNDYTTYNRYTFFKNTLSESQLIQVLRMFEFLVSDAGEKLCFYGTKEMGTYEEDENGNIRYTDEQIMNEMTNSATYGNDTVMGLGLAHLAWPGRIMNHASKYWPNIVYAKELSTWKKAFNPRKYGVLETVPGMQPMIYADAFLTQFEGAKNFWNARNGFEDAMVRVFAAKTDEEFEKRFNEMVKYAEDKGLTDEFYKEATKWYKEVYNKDFMHLIEK